MKPAPARERWLAALAIFAVTFVLFWPATGHPFIDLDDPDYVVENAHIAEGLSVRTVTWAFSTFYAANWHPLTWLSHALDLELYGLQPFGHHQTNVLLHALNAALLFLLLRGATGRPWPAAFVAAFFAVHPLRVESVAWVAERKDVLAGSFWLLTMLAYAAYARRPAPVRYALVVLLFAMGLAAKPMLVTLPFVLLLFDFWPLGRLSAPLSFSRSAGRLVVEKIPLFALAAASSAVTFIAQKSGGAVRSMDFIPLADRIGNAALSVVRYLVGTVWPSGLAPFYPLPSTTPTGLAILAAVVVAALTVGAAAIVARRPALSVGWLWWIGTLVPVIGLVQVGEQALADRYTYLPHIGLFIAVVWTALDLADRRPRGPRTAIVVGACAILVLSAATRVQLNHWRSTRALFEHTIAVTTNNWFGEFVLGTALEKEGDLEAAIARYDRAAELRPGRAEIQNNYGHALFALGRADEAEDRFRRALELQPRFAGALTNLGRVRESEGALAEAEALHRQALAIRPDDPEILNNLGHALFLQRRLTEAVDCLRRALARRPGLAVAWSNLGAALAEGGDLPGAAEAFGRAVSVGPDDPSAHYNLGVALALMGRKSEAIVHLRRAVELRPQDPDARARLADLLNQ